MAIMRKGTGRDAFLPKGSVAALRRLGIRTGGVALIALVTALATALLTAHPADPSWNTAASVPVANALGHPGAVIADLLLQTFGATTALPLLVVLGWAIRIIARADVPSAWPWRSAALLGAVIAASMALAPLPVETSIAPGAGGAVGQLLFGLLPDELGWLGAVVAGVFGLAGAGYALGLSREEWSWTGTRMRSAVAQFRQGAPVDSGRRGDPRMRIITGTTPPGARPVRAKATEPPPAPVEMDDGDAEEDFAPTPVLEDDDDRGGMAEAAFMVPPARGALVQPKSPPPTPGQRERATRQGALDLGAVPLLDYDLPPLEVLTLPPEQQGTPRVNQDALAQNAKMLETVLEDFGVNGKVVKVRPGPVVTLYELEPAPGTKTSRVIGLADDIARSMSALSVRIATIPGRSVIGIELPNQRREIVFLRELLASEHFEKSPSRLTLVLGKDIGGSPVMVDLARMPHLLIAGTTGSGKSVAVNTMILSLLYRLRPEECRLIMIDPKMLELSVYDGIPHLLAPVVTEPGKAVVALKWAVREMEDRYRAMSQLGVRNIAGYNQRLGEAAERGETLTRTVQTGFDPESGKPIYEDQVLALQPLPFIVIIVDEMADLMLVAGKDIEGAVQRLAQMARAAGIHLIMATQRPSVDVITGTIKANFPTRISFQVTSKIDSRTILGEQGAEQLLGQGDMLYMAAGGRITRVHGPFVSDQEVEKVVEHLRSQGQPAYIDAVTEEPLEELGGGAGAGGAGSGDDLYDQAVALVAREGKASTSFIQRHLQIGYNRAARLIERMEAEGVVGKPNHVGKREVLVRGGGREEF